MSLGPSRRRARFVRVLMLASGLAITSSASQTQAQEPALQARPLGERYPDGLGGALIGAPVGAAGGALVGLLLPLAFCNAGVGQGGCDAAWIGTGMFALGGWLLGTTFGSAIALEVQAGNPLAAGGIGLLAGGLMFGAGMGLHAATDEPAFVAVSFGLWTVTTLLVTPLVMAAMNPDPPLAVSAGPIGFLY